MDICKCNYRDIKTLPSNENQSVNLQNNSIDLLQKDDTFQLVFLVMKLKCHQLISLLMSCFCLPIWTVTFSEACTSKSNNFLTLYLSANPTKWSVTLKQFVDCCRRMVWVCLTILWGWRIKTHPEPIQTSKIDLLLLFS